MKLKHITLLKMKVIPTIKSLVTNSKKATTALIALLLLSFTSAHGQHVKYLLILNPGDCFKCAFQFANLERFMNNNNLSPIIVSPVKSREGAEFLLKKFDLNFTKYELELKPHKYKEYNKNSAYSSIHILYDGKIVFSEIIALLDTNRVPIINNNKPKLASTLKNINEALPYYANTLVIKDNNLLIHNGFNQTLFFQKDGIFHEMQFDSLFINNLLLEILNGDTIKLLQNLNFLTKYKLLRAKVLRVNAFQEIYAIIEIPTFSEITDSYLPVNFLITFNEKMQIKKWHRIHDSFIYKDLLFWSAFIFDFGIKKHTNELILFVTRGHDNTLYDNQDSSFFVLSEYSVCDTGYVFQKVLPYKLPKYQIANEHYYRNLWGLLDVNNAIGGVFGFQYLNEVGTLKGEKIELESLSIDKLKLPYEPGGPSKKPFEIIQIKYDSNQLRTIVWKNGYTWLYCFTSQGKLISRHKLVKSPIKPAAYIDSNTISLLNGTLKGELDYYKFNF